MSYKSPQDKPGTRSSKSSNNVNRGGRSDGRDPLGRPGGTGNQVSTNYPQKVTGPEKVARGGRTTPSEQNERGYSKAGSSNLGPIQDVTVAPDGTRRVQGDKGNNKG